MAEDNIKKKISQNHDEIYSLIEYLSTNSKKSLPMLQMLRK